MKIPKLVKIVVATGLLSFILTSSGCNSTKYTNKEPPGWVPPGNLFFGITSSYLAKNSYKVEKEERINYKD